MVKYTKEELADFEQSMASLYAEGNIRFPIHLRGSEDFAYENALISFFEKENIGANDWFFGYWDTHLLALLKGVPQEEVKQGIIDGKSIALCFPQHNFYASGIVGSLFGVACGVAYRLKKDKVKGRVYCYAGDMASFCGSFYESLQYAYNWDLPLTFLVGDNNVSVMTDTKQVWGGIPMWHHFLSGSAYSNKIHYFKYKNKYSHSGLKTRIAF